IEITLAMLLLFRRWRLQALYLSLTLMTSFSAYIVAITRFSEYIPCSCGGVLEKMSWDQHLLFNIGFVIITVIAILVYPSTNLHTNRGYRKPENRVGNISLFKN